MHVVTAYISLGCAGVSGDPCTSTTQVTHSTQSTLGPSFQPAIRQVINHAQPSLSRTQPTEAEGSVKEVPGIAPRSCRMRVCQKFSDYGFWLKKPNKDRVGYHIVSDVFENRPAAEAGLKVGDHIIEVNDENVTNLSQDDLKKRCVQSAEDSECVLLVLDLLSVKNLIKMKHTTEFSNKTSKSIADTGIMHSQLTGSTETYLNSLFRTSTSARSGISTSVHTSALRLASTSIPLKIISLNTASTPNTFTTSNGSVRPNITSNTAIAEKTNVQTIEETYLTESSFNAIGEETDTMLLPANIPDIGRADDQYLENIAAQCTSGFDARRLALIESRNDLLSKAPEEIEDGTQGSAEVRTEDILDETLNACRYSISAQRQINQKNKNSLDPFFDVFEYKELKEMDRDKSLKPVSSRLNAKVCLQRKVGALLYEVRQQGMGAINPKDYFKEMKVLDPTFITGVQQDSDELLKKLFPKLIEDGASCARCKRHIAQSSSNSSDILQNLSTIDRIFGLQLNSALICEGQNCTNISENLATEYTIAVALSSNTIVGCLKNYFGMVELETPAVCDLCHRRSL
ncbi:unnamed protein product, partial [Didymodactylos carnosus]